MGAYGTATLFIVSSETGKRRKLTSANRPTWRPLARLTGHATGWDGRTFFYEAYYQDWATLLSSVSDTGGETICLMKHPHQ